MGAEYLRTRTETPSKAKDDTKSSGKSSTPVSLPSSSNDFNLASFGRARNVKLGPMKRAHDGDKPHGSGVKKTRFITSKGIREAGRDSLGGPEARTISDGDDDELEFV